MLRHRQKPPRLPKAKAAPRPSSEWFDGVLGLLLGLFGILIASRLLLAALSAMPAIAAVGDRISVGPATLLTPDIAAHDITDPAGGTGAACRLDLAVMKYPGGVFSVLAVRADGVVLSWAGGPTAHRGDGCDTGDQSVLVAPDDYALLLKRQAAKH